MNLKQLDRAKKMAARGYQIRVEKETEHDGPSIYVAYIPEIPGCVAQGDSAEHARTEMRIVLIDVISYLLEADLEVPAPRTQKGSATLQIGDSEAAVFPPVRAQMSPVSTGSRVMKVDELAPCTSWAAAYVPSRVRA